MTELRLERGQFGWEYYLVRVPYRPTVQGPLAYDDTNSVYVRSDWDYPGTASIYGWSPCHDSTDGTIDCPECGRSASDLIASASDYLDEHIGEVAEDPGYF